MIVSSPRHASLRHSICPTFPFAIWVETQRDTLLLDQFHETKLCLDRFSAEGKRTCSSVFGKGGRGGRGPLNLTLWILKNWIYIYIFDSFERFLDSKKEFESSENLRLRMKYSDFFSFFFNDVFCQWRAKNRGSLGLGIIEFFRIGAKELRSNEAGEKNKKKKNEYIHTFRHIRVGIRAARSFYKIWRPRRPITDAQPSYVNFHRYLHLSSIRRYRGNQRDRVPLITRFSCSQLAPPTQILPTYCRAYICHPAKK